MRRAAAWIAAVALLGCASDVPPIPVEGSAGVSVGPAAALSFQRRADGFYLRLAHRRFNTLETFNDFILRDHFETVDLFFDYYADLAQALNAAHFERSRPERIQIEDFAFRDPRNVRVKVLFVFGI